MTFSSRLKIIAGIFTENLQILNKECILFQKQYKTFFMQSISVSFQHTESNRSTYSLHQANPQGTAVIENKRNVSNNENNYARSLLLNPVYYFNTVVFPPKIVLYVTDESAKEILDKDWSLMSNDELIVALKKLSHHAANATKNLDPILYHNMLTNLIDRCKTMDKFAQFEIMKLLIPLQWLNHYSPQFTNLMNTLDELSYNNMTTYTLNEKFLLCDIFYCLKVSKTSKFVPRAMLKISSKADKLTSRQLIQLFFLLNIARKPPINIYNLEYRLEQVIEDIMPNELSIIAMGFFKTKTSIKSNDLVKTILTKVTKNINLMNEISIAEIMKIFKFSKIGNETKYFIDFLEAVKPHIPQLSLMALIHIAQASAALMAITPEVTNGIIDRFEKEMSAARYKDIERLIIFLRIFNIPINHAIYQKIINELKARKKEITKFPNILLSIVYNLGLMNIYEPYFINLMRDPDYMNKISFGNLIKLPMQYVCLENSLELESNNFQPILPDRIKKTLIYKLHHYYDRESFRFQKLSSEVFSYCKTILNTEDKVYLDCVLPHFIKKDIFFGLNERDEVVSLDSIFTKEWKLIRYPRADDLTNVTCIALVLAHPNLLVKEEVLNTANSIFDGQLNAKIRQLKCAGYMPILIHQFEWNNLKEYEKSIYLKNLIFSKKSNIDLIS
ncbi:uncharacterized protein [Prorops nasuta]|uniref:uncharacterized protein isoform X2 n=1 Tax=Prorops nasuta TaxID=863751 RepID=UPI0034CE0AB5